MQLSSGQEEGVLNIKTFLLYLFCSFGIILVNIAICTTSEQFFLTACVVFICLFFKVFPEYFYKVQVTQIYNLFLLLSAQTCCQKWLSKCWKCHFRDPRTKKFPVAYPGLPRRLGLYHLQSPFQQS